MKSFVTVSTDGFDGSGKTCTMAQLAVGLALEYHEKPKVFVFDSNRRWPAWKKWIFDVEGVELDITYGRSLVAVQYAIRRCADARGSVFIPDDLSIAWQEGLRTFAFENGTLTFERRQQLMNEWSKITEPFLLGEFDAIACGRLGYNWERIEDPETGEQKLLQGDSKFNAGGGNNFAYDCALELEMRRKKRRFAGLLRGRTSMEYVCDVIKDANGIINGQQFIFQDFNGGYRKGDYRKVLDQFRPHIEFVRSLSSPQFCNTSSSSLIVSGKTAWAQDQTERKGLLEDLKSNLELCFPSGEGRSNMAKMFRDLTLEHLNSFISWSRMEEEISTGQIRDNLDFVKALRKRIESKEIPTSQEYLFALFLGTHEDLIGKPHRSAIEILGEHSALIECESKHGPQPVDAIGRKYNVAR